MRIFITGATGFIGLNVALALRRAGHDIWGLARSADKAQKLERHEIQPVIGSLDDPGTYVGIAEKCSILIHAAQDNGPQKVLFDRNVVESFVGVGAKGPQPKTFIYTSGCWVYGDTGANAVDEGSIVHPASLVSWRPSHEQMVLTAPGVRGLVVRPGCVYGRQGSLTDFWFKGPSQGKPPLVVGDGQNRWSMIHIDDLALGYLRLTESGRSSEIFNFSDRSRFTVGEMATAAARAAGYKGPLEPTPLPNAESRLGPLAGCLALDQHIDSRKAVRMLGWQPRHGGFVDGVQTYYMAWKAHQS